MVGLSAILPQSGRRSDAAFEPGAILDQEHLAFRDTRLPSDLFAWGVGRFRARGNGSRATLMFLVRRQQRFEQIPWTKVEPIADCVPKVAPQLFRRPALTPEPTEQLSTRQHVVRDT